MQIKCNKRISVNVIYTLGGIDIPRKDEDIVNISTKHVVLPERNVSQGFNSSTINLLEQYLSKYSAHLWADWNSVCFVVISMSNHLVERLSERSRYFDVRFRKRLILDCPRQAMGVDAVKAF